MRQIRGTLTASWALVSPWLLSLVGAAEKVQPDPTRPSIQGMSDQGEE
jgi:hypothetical protein